MEKLKLDTTVRLNKAQQEFILQAVKDSFITANVSFQPSAVLFEDGAGENLQELEKLVKKLLFIARGIGKGQVLVDNEVDIKFDEDPLVILKRNDEVIDIGEGLFLFQGEFLRLFRSLDRAIYGIATNEFHAIEQENPILWPMEVFKKVNYLNEFPQQALLVSGVQKQHSKLEEFASNHSSSCAFETVSSKKYLDDARVGLQPAVCDTCYYGLRNRKNVQNTFYTTYNKVFRNEHSDSASLDRLMAFTVRDIMFVGDKNFALESRQKLIERLKKFFDTTGLNYSIEVANDPFFSSNVEKKFFQQQFELKYEILVWIPFLSKKIAVGSINLHLDTFSSAFNIYQGEELVHSGCIGIGFERLLLALYSQHGNDLNLWPEKLVKLIKSH